MSSKSTSRFQIAVVGGGIVGKACALLLAQQGMQVALVAPRPAGDTARTGDDDWDSRIYAFSASSQALLERLRGSARPGASAGARHARVRRRKRGRPIRPHGDLHFSAYAAAVPQLAWIIESSHVERVLDTALRFQHQVQWFDDGDARARHRRRRR
jgi:2-polyprenyl-6-methoxyphenol hydroxylase-like FAD-dependent oxidoreductase